MKSTLLFLAAFVPLTLAQYGNPDSKSSSSVAAPVTTASAASSGKVHTVTVGDDQKFLFQPNSLTAAAGDIIQFQIYPTHSVSRSNFANPCSPIGATGAVWSGFSSDENTFFSVTVNDTNPLWFYCAAPGHCQAGMGMAVNPSGADTIQAYLSAAKSSSGGATPVNIAGGVFGKAAAGSASSGSASASGSAAATSTSASATIASASAGAAAGKMAVDALLAVGVVAGGAAFVL